MGRGRKGESARTDVEGRRVVRERRGISSVKRSVRKTGDEGRDWPEWEKRGHPGGTRGAAAHRHSLDRLND